MQDKITGIDRQEYIQYLIQFTNKTEAYFEKLTDREVIVEYERLMKLD